MIKNLFASIENHAGFDKNMCESDGLIKQRICLFKAKISQNK